VVAGSFEVVVPVAVGAMHVKAFTTIVAPHLALSFVSFGLESRQLALSGPAAHAQGLRDLLCILNVALLCLAVLGQLH
jgi:hypothetical protein